MHDVAHPSGLAEIPQEHRDALSALIRQRGIVYACRVSGLGRAALLSVIARGAATRGTAALLREFMARGLVAEPGLAPSVPDLGLRVGRDIA